MIEIVRSGVSGLLPGYESDMPAYENVLSERQISAVLAYIKSTWPEDKRRHQERISQQAERNAGR